MPEFAMEGRDLIDSAALALIIGLAAFIYHL